MLVSMGTYPLMKTLKDKVNVFLFEVLKVKSLQNQEKYILFHSSLDQKKTDIKDIRVIMVWYMRPALCQASGWTHIVFTMSLHHNI